MALEQNLHDQNLSDPSGILQGLELIIKKIVDPLVLFLFVVVVAVLQLFALFKISGGKEKRESLTERMKGCNSATKFYFFYFLQYTHKKKKNFVSPHICLPEDRKSGEKGQERSDKNKKQRPPARTGFYNSSITPDDDLIVFNQASKKSSDAGSDRDHSSKELNSDSRSQQEEDGLDNEGVSQNQNKQFLQQDK